MKSPGGRLLDLMREIDAKRTITRARAAQIYGGKNADATWKRIKRRLAENGCVLLWDRQKKRFYVADPLWTVERPQSAAASNRRHYLSILRATATALGAPFIDKLAPHFARWDAEFASASSTEGVPPAPLRPQPRADETFYKNLTLVECALRDKRMLSFTYSAFKGGRATARQIEPYAIHEHVGRFYVWGREKVKQAPKFFAIDRMGDVELEDEFEPDPDLSLDRALAQSFGMYVGKNKTMRIVVAVDKERASYVRARRWPAEVACDDMPDGSLRIAFEVNDPQEVVAWVLGFAGTARITEPAAAADLARRSAERMSKDHGWSKRAPLGDGLIEFEWPKGQ